MLGPVNLNNSVNTINTSFVKALPSPGQHLINNPDPRIVAVPLHREHFVIGGLEEFHVYTFTLYLANSAGRSVTSNPIIQELPGAGIVLAAVSSSHLLCGLQGTILKCSYAHLIIMVQ